jgi:transketolase
MRTAFIKQLTKEAKTNERIFLIVGDLGFNVIEEFAELFPDRFLNAGIAEQNMAGIAAGLAIEGYNVYIYSIGNFPTLRCMEQIRYDIAYHNVNVKIVAVGGGYAYGSLGASHHATEELGMLRTIPNITVCAPGDPVETRALVRWSAKYCGPVYLRLGKAGEPIVHEKEITMIKAGDILQLREGKEVAILTTGAMLAKAVKNTNDTISIYSFPFVKPINGDILLEIAKKYDRLITVEEHQLSCGFGSAITEQINDMYANGYIKRYPQIIRKGIKDTFCSISGTEKFLIQSEIVDFKSI